jgi:hypothetical protein
LLGEFAIDPEHRPGYFAPLRVATSAAGIFAAMYASLLGSCHVAHESRGTARESVCAVVLDSAIDPPPGDIYASTPDQVIAPLRGAIDAALCPPESANHSALVDTAAALDASLETRRDVMPLGRVRVSLEEAPEADEPRFQAVLQVLASTQRAYHFNDVATGRPTLFLIHGSDRGPFDTFAPYFERLGHSHNIIFLLYDSFQPTSRKATWLAHQIRAWRKSGPPEDPLHIIAWSDGTTVLRKALVDDDEGLFRNARIVNLAPPLAGSYRARWVDDGPMRVVAFPALLYLNRNSYLIDMAQDYNPYGDLMAELYDHRANELLAEHLGAGSELNVVVDGDPHAPHSPVFDFLEPKFEEFVARYEGSLGRNHVRLPARTDNPHQDVTRDPDAIRAVMRHLSEESTSRDEREPSDGEAPAVRRDALVDHRHGRA